MNHYDSPTPDELLAAKRALAETDPNNTTFLVTDEDGVPAAVVHPDQVITTATSLAFRLAAVAGDRPAVDRVMAQTLSAVGAEAFGYVCAGALTTLTNEILAGALDVADAAGIHLRPGLVALAEGRDPSTGQVSW